MLTIRGAQIEALRRAREAQFDRELVAHLGAVWPARVSRMGDDGALRFAAACREKALAYGAAQPLDVARFAGVALFLGLDFDDDPGLPWAREILEGRAPTATAKIDQLVIALDAWIDALAAGDGERS